MTEQAYHEKRFSIYLACYVYGTEYSSGQWSNAYQLLCSVTGPGKLRPGLGPITEETLRRTDPEAALFLDKLIKRRY